MPLTTPQLTRYIGQPVQYERLMLNWDDPSEEKWSPQEGILDARLLYDLEVNQNVRNVKPVLRHITSLTEEEVKGCMRSSFGFCRSIKIDRLADGIWITDGIYKLRMADNGRFLSYISENEMSRFLPELLNAPALIDYLDSIHIDTRGYLQSGDAVAE